ncbi:MAG TPA: aspartyl protease family protein [Asticcacaulis sp.]|nr:aspartyl protease family protein [Asticcacaulis sp.]
MKPGAGFPFIHKGAPSRRAALSGLAALLAAGSARAQTPDAAPAPEPPPSADIATRNDASQRLTVEVHINGAGPYHFIVDTGAERSVIADTVAAELNLAPIGRVTIDGVVRQIPADLVKVDSLNYGPFALTNARVPVLPRQYLLVDGYLGLDAIADSRVTFDFHHHLMHIDPPGSRQRSLASDGDTIRVVMHGSQGRLSAKHCWVDGVPAAAFVDSGAEVSMGNSALLTALQARRVRFQDLGPIVLTGVTGGETQGEVITTNSIRLQEMTVENSLLAISDTASFAAWGLADEPALLLGMNFLRQFDRVTIDYRRGEVRFELSEANRTYLVAQS